MKVSFTIHTIKYIIHFTIDKKLLAYFGALKKDLTLRTILPPEDWPMSKYSADESLFLLRVNVRKSAVRHDP